MGSEEFQNVYVTYNDRDLGFFKEIVINSNEVRLYNPDLVKVLTFDSYKNLYHPDGIYGLNFFGEDEVNDIEYQEEPATEDQKTSYRLYLDVKKALERIEEEQSTKPSHYFHNGIEAIDIIAQAMRFYGDAIDGFEGFCIGNIYKYLLRFKFKDQLISDLEKVKVYVDKLIERFDAE